MKKEREEKTYYNSTCAGNLQIVEYFFNYIISMQCIVCNWPDNSSLLQFPCGCLNPIHPQCIDKWRAKNNICPKCSTVLINILPSVPPFPRRHYSNNSELCPPMCEWYCASFCLISSCIIGVICVIVLLSKTSQNVSVFLLLNRYM